MLVLAKIIYDLFHALDIDKNGETRLTINEEKEKIKKEKKNKKRYKQYDVQEE
jgi:predicted nucleotidyltransferase component of viral defense system